MTAAQGLNSQRVRLLKVKALTNQHVCAKTVSEVPEEKRRRTAGLAAAEGF